MTGVNENGIASGSKIVSGNGAPTLVDADLGILSLQPAFVEGIERTGRRFSTLTKAYRHIFRRNLEWGILLWSDVPVRISYRQDLPAMVEPLTDLLIYVVKADDGHGDFSFETPNLETRWRVELSGEMMELRSRWLRVKGDYEAALNEAVGVRMPRQDFLCEWKLLLQQLLKAFADSGASLSRQQSRDRFEILRELEAAIPARGRFYRYEDAGDETLG